ncbi:MAG: ATP-binding cassette domain-containing protein, partial [Cyclobacteriaceae bacterium]|nr:ATP-binding cassette domain-containing protein [Cyclobacteriaceae bacterium]
MLKATHIHKSYGTLQVLKGIDLSIHEREIVSIVGASGAGKSTLLHIMGTLDHPDQGVMEIKGNNIFTLSPDKLARFRNQHIGFIFQFHNLLPEFTALENVCMPGFIGQRKSKEVKKEASFLLEMLGLDDRKMHKPSELSGG